MLRSEMRTEVRYIVGETTKACRTCGETKPLESFHRRAGALDGRRADCAVCNTDKAKEYYAANREAVRGKARQRNTGVTTEQYDAALAGQAGCCAICGTDDPRGRGLLHADHDHKTGEFRALLCHGCNTGLGLFTDDADLLLAAAAYLMQHGE